MEKEMATILIGLGFFVLMVIIYALYCLLTDPPPELDERSVRISRFLGNLKLFDPIFAKPLTKREKVGWLIFFLVLALGVLFTQVTGLGA